MNFFVTSAAYVSADLQAEFGNIPPAFLPVGNRRLFHHIFGVVPESLPKFLSIPENYNADPADLNALGDLGIALIRVPSDISLGESVLYCINWIGEYDQDLAILHGDTLIGDISYDNADCFLVGQVTDNYQWAIVANSDPNVTYAGYFSISNIPVFVQCLLTEHQDFVHALERYRERVCVDLAVTTKWRDFGHASTYYRSKASLSTERAFNNLRIDGQTVRKSSSKGAKLAAEASWYQKVPQEVDIYTPKLISACGTGEQYEYTIEYLHLSTLSELFVFGRLPTAVWETIFSACERFLTVAHSHRATDRSPASLFGEKTHSRLLEFCEQANIDANRPWVFNGRDLPTLSDIVEQTTACIHPDYTNGTTLIHGDFCFSNIFFDFRTLGIKVIDPRGQDSYGNATIYGDPRYDFAKFAHSAVGLYDLIMAGYYEVSIDGEYNLSFDISSNENVVGIQKLFMRRQLAGHSMDDKSSFPMIIQLFLSMLPFHTDSKARQFGLLGNAMRLYAEWRDAS